MRAPGRETHITASRQERKSMKGSSGKRGRKSNADEKRLEILDAFYRCAVREGLNNASLRVVAEEVDTPVSVLLHYFKNREAMISALIKKRHSDILATLKKKIEDLPKSERRFEIIINYLFGTERIRAKRNSYTYDACSAAHRSRTVRSTLKKLICDEREKFTGILAETAQFSSLSAADRKHIVNTILALVEGTLYLTDMDEEHVSVDGMSRFLIHAIKLYAMEKKKSG
jgi:AcrR family transcriptional regulator